MNDIAIRVEGLSKLYRIGVAQPRYHTLRDWLADTFGWPFRRAWSAINGRLSANGGRDETIWALKHVSFEVKHGGVVGVIGRNGAGKTTLLKILSRITEPTEGRAEIYGRVGSLLEVGTGFHPELTGRENIYLNGAILGMTRVEIHRKLDEIVAFAEVEKFADTPVKRYSSGMHMRLAFAVAAHLEHEILLVDEVLAVGDIAFQKKCLGKMGNIAKHGRTVLFVSHQMNQIRRLCQRCMWIEGGRVRQAGRTAEVVAHYEARMTANAPERTRDIGDDNVRARFIGWEIADTAPAERNVLTTVGSVTVRFALRVNRPITHGCHGIALFDNEQRLIWAAAVDQLQLTPGDHAFNFTLPSLPLRPGAYRWLVSMYDAGDLVELWHSLPDLIVATEPVTHPLDNWQGILNLPWRFQLG